MTSGQSKREADMVYECFLYGCLGKALADVNAVPGDDAAVERAARRLYDMSDERVRVDGVEWENEPDGYKMLWRDKARAVFDAARETTT